MKYAIIFILLGLAAALLLLSYRQPWQVALIINVSLCFIGLGIGFGWLGPKIFFKRSDGRLGWLSYLLFWPYHLLNGLSLTLVRLQPKRNVFDEVVSNLFLGRRLLPFDRAAFRQLGICGTLDLTCEFGESKFVRTSGAYQCIPLLDTFAPTVEQLEKGVQWMREQGRQGPIYVHCAMGHGRSAVYVAAFLIADGQVKSIEEAMDILRTKRPGIDIKPIQFQALDLWARQYEA